MNAYVWHPCGGTKLANSILSGGLRDQWVRARNHLLGPLFENSLLIKVILRVFFVKIVMPQGCGLQFLMKTTHKCRAQGAFSCFPVISFLIFLCVGDPFGLPIAQEQGPCPLVHVKAYLYLLRSFNYS